MSQNVTPPKNYENHFHLPIDLVLVPGHVSDYLRVLVVVYHHAGDIRYDEIGRVLTMTPREVKRQCAKLAAEGLVERLNGKVRRTPEGLPDVPEAQGSALFHARGVLGPNGSSRSDTKASTLVPLKRREAKRTEGAESAAWERLVYPVTEEEFTRLRDLGAFEGDGVNYWANQFPALCEKHGLLDKAREIIAGARAEIAPEVFAAVLVIRAIATYPGTIKSHPNALATSIVAKWREDDARIAKGGQVELADLAEMKLLRDYLAPADDAPSSYQASRARFTARSETIKAGLRGERSSELPAGVDPISPPTPRNEVEAHDETEEQEPMTDTTEADTTEADLLAEVEQMIATRPATAPRPKLHERRSTRLDGSMGITGDYGPATPRNLDAEDAEFERRWAESQARRAAERAATAAPEPERRDVPPGSQWATDDDDEWEREDDAFPAAAE